MRQPRARPALRRSSRKAAAFRFWRPDSYRSDRHAQEDERRSLADFHRSDDAISVAPDSPQKHQHDRAELHIADSAIYAEAKPRADQGRRQGYHRPDQERAIEEARDSGGQE